MDETKYIIVDKKTGEILKSKIYTHEGTANLQVKKGGFYLSHQEPVVIGLNTALTKLMAQLNETFNSKEKLF